MRNLHDSELEIASGGAPGILAPLLRGGGGLLGLGAANFFGADGIGAALGGGILSGGLLSGSPASALGGAVIGGGILAADPFIDDILADPTPLPGLEPPAGTIPPISF